MGGTVHLSSVKESFLALSEAAENVGIIVNEERTKFMQITKIMKKKSKLENINLKLSRNLSILVLF